jgi:hypothetical protein
VSRAIVTRHRHAPSSRAIVTRHRHAPSSRAIVTVRSIDIIEPLIANRSSPAWLCWVKHVELLRFVLQREVCAATGKQRVRALVQEFYALFSSVPEWQDGGYEKPKMHLLHELGQALAEFGPWRSFWCMPWEAFLQVVKRIFDGTNYNNGPFAVCTFWAAKSVIRYRDSKRRSWYTDSIESDEEFSLDLPRLAVTSQLAAALLQEPPELRPYAVRHASSFTREREQIDRGDWVHVQQDETQVVALVRDIMECMLETEQGVHSVIRIWCVGCVEPHVGSHGEMWAHEPPADNAMLVSLEDVLIVVKTRVVHAQHDVYT